MSTDTAGHGRAHDDRRGHGHDDGHGHSHGLVARSIVSSRDGLRAVLWSLLVLLITTVLQLGVFVVTGSIALLADLIHNFGDALTAVPLGIAFLLRSFKAEKRAGYFVVAAIFVSAMVALGAAEYDRKPSAAGPIVCGDESLPPRYISPAVVWPHVRRALSAALTAART